MPGNTRKSPIIAMPTIRNVVGQIHGNNLYKILDKHWEDVPDGDFTNTKKLEFIIAAVPFAGCYSASALYTALVLDNRTMPIDRDSVVSRPAMYRRLGKYAPEVLRDLTGAFGMHKRAPTELLENDNWVGLMALKEMLRHMTAPSEIQNAPSVVKSIQEDMRRTAEIRLRKTLESDRKLATCCEAFTMLLRD